MQFPNLLPRLRAGGSWNIDATDSGASWLVAGSSVLRCLESSPRGFDSTSDVDVFLCCPRDDQSAVAALVKRIWRAVAVEGECWALTRTSNVANPSAP